MPELYILAAIGATVVIGGAALVMAIGPAQLLPPMRVRAAPWGAGWLLLSFLLLFYPKELAARLHGGEDVVWAGLRYSAMFLPLQVFIVFAVMRWFHRVATPLGRVSWRSVASGFATWLVIGSITLAINMLVRSLVEWQGGPKTTEHPLVRQLQANPHDSWLWALIAIETIVCAAVREELFFRGIAQPWAVSRPYGGASLVILAASAATIWKLPDNPFGGELAPLAFAFFVGGGLLAVAPFIGRLRLGGLGNALFPRMALGGQNGEQAFRGICGTAVLFAMVHTSGWPDPIPLLVLGLGLGWLQWRTQSLLAPIVCHALFNASTVLQIRALLLMNP